jgi:multidrug efflux pump
VTFFGLLLTPVFYVLIRNFVERGQARKAAKVLKVQSQLESH